MNETLAQRKAELRQIMRKKLGSLTADARAAAATAACERLQTQKVWQEAETILFFAPLRDELNIWPSLENALRTGKEVFLPRFDPDKGQYFACRLKDAATDLRTGEFGIREPGPHCRAAPLNRLDLVLVPGVAFDLHGGRLGRGKGHYDQILAAVRGQTCGVAFDEQIVAEVPVEPHDITVHCILTPTRWVEP